MLHPFVLVPAYWSLLHDGQQVSAKQTRRQNRQQAEAFCYVATLPHLGRPTHKSLMSLMHWAWYVQTSAAGICRGGGHQTGVTQGVSSVITMAASGECVQPHSGAYSELCATTSNKYCGQSMRSRSQSYLVLSLQPRVTLVLGCLQTLSTTTTAEHTEATMNPQLLARLLTGDKQHFAVLACADSVHSAFLSLPSIGFPMLIHDSELLHTPRQCPALVKTSRGRWHSIIATACL